MAVIQNYEVIGEINQVKTLVYSIEEFEKARVKPFVRTRRGRLEQVGGHERTSRGSGKMSLSAFKGLLRREGRYLTLYPGSMSRNWDGTWWQASWAGGPQEGFTDHIKITAHRKFDGLRYCRTRATEEAMMREANRRGITLTDFADYSQESTFTKKDAEQQMKVAQQIADERGMSLDSAFQLVVQAKNVPLTADKTPYAQRSSEFTNIVETAKDRNKLEAPKQKPVAVKSEALKNAEEKLNRLTAERETAWAEYNKVKDDPKIEQWLKDSKAKRTREANSAFYKQDDLVSDLAAREKYAGRQDVEQVVNRLERMKGEVKYEDFSVEEDGYTLDFMSSRFGGGLFTPRRDEEDDDHPLFTGRQQVIDTVQAIVGKDYQVSAWAHEKGMFSVGVKKIEKALVFTIDEAFEKGRGKDLKPRKRRGFDYSIEPRTAYEARKHMLRDEKMRRGRKQWAW